MNDKRWVIEDKDIITFDLKIKKNEEEAKSQKFKNKVITIGKNEILDGIDDAIKGNDTSEDKYIEFELTLPKSTSIFEQMFEPGLYIFSFKILKLQKFDSREQLDVSKMKTSHDDKQKIKELEEIKEKLLSKIEKLEAEKQMSEHIFKAKAEEMAKNAASKVETLKEEIKNKAKEDVEYKTKFAIQKLVDDLLSPLNNLYVAVKAGSNASDPNISAYVKGFDMLTNQIFNVLESHGIYVIEPKEGEIFNPEFHHAQELIEDPTYQKDQIVKLISRGYKLHDRVLRPAIVIVSK